MAASWPGRPNKAMSGSNDVSKWLCRKRNGYWWIWRPHEFMPMAQLVYFDPAWRPPEGNYL